MDNVSDSMSEDEVLVPTRTKPSRIPTVPSSLQNSVWNLSESSKSEHSSSSSDSDSDLGDLLGYKASRKPKIKKVAVDSSHDDLGLIVIPKSGEKRLQLVTNDRQIKESLTKKNKALEEYKQKMETLKEKLEIELQDNGTDELQDYSDLIEQLVEKSDDILSFNRNFYCLNELKPKIIDPFPAVTHNNIDVVAKDVFGCTNLLYLHHADEYLSRLMKDKKSIQFKMTSEQAQLGINLRDKFQFKLHHINRQPLVNLLRVKLFIKLHILSYDGFVPPDLLQIFIFTLSDTNLVKHHFEELVDFARMAGPISKISHTKIGDFIDNIQATTYTYESTPIESAKLGLQYHILHMLNLGLRPKDHPIPAYNQENIANTREEIRAITKKYMDYTTLGKYSTLLKEIPQVEAGLLLSDPTLINTFHRHHHGLRLLNFVIDYNLTAADISHVAANFAAAKNEYHKLMGKVALSEASSDVFNQKSRLVGLIDEDYMYLNYFHVKFSKLSSIVSGDQFYDS